MTENNEQNGVSEKKPAEKDDAEYISVFQSIAKLILDDLKRILLSDETRHFPLDSTQHPLINSFFLTVKIDLINIYLSRLKADSLLRKSTSDYTLYKSKISNVINHLWQFLRQEIKKKGQFTEVTRRDLRSRIPTNSDKLIFGNFILQEHRKYKYFSQFVESMLSKIQYNELTPSELIESIFPQKDSYNLKAVKNFINTYVPELNSNASGENNFYLVEILNSTNPFLEILEAAFKLLNQSDNNDLTVLYSENFEHLVGLVLAYVRIKNSINL